MSKEASGLLSVEEESEGVDELIHRGQEKGYLHSDEVGRVFPADGCSPDDLDEVFSLLDDVGIELVGSEEQFGAIREKLSSKTDKEQRRQLDPTTDPVRVYLREIGGVPLLTRQAEVEIAKRIERNQAGVLKALSRSGAVVAEILGFADQLRKGALAVEKLMNLGDDKRSAEILQVRREEVLTRVSQIAELEAAASELRLKLNKTKNSRHGR